MSSNRRWVFVYRGYTSFVSQTIVTLVPGGWVVAHIIYAEGGGGTASSTLFIDDSGHLADPADFRALHEIEDGDAKS